MESFKNEMQNIVSMKKIKNWTLNGLGMTIHVQFHGVDLNEGDFNSNWQFYYVAYSYECRVPGPFGGLW